MSSGDNQPDSSIRLSRKQNGLAGFLREHRIQDSRILTLQQLIAEAVAAVEDKAVLESSVLIVTRIVRQLETLRQAIAEHDKKITELAESHPDYGIFSSF